MCKCENTLLPYDGIVALEASLSNILIKIGLEKTAKTFFLNNQ